MLSRKLGAQMLGAIFSEVKCDKNSVAAVYQYGRGGAASTSSYSYPNFLSMQVDVSEHIYRNSEKFLFMSSRWLDDIDDIR